jgi:hypothetical protein
VTLHRLVWEGTGGPGEHLGQDVHLLPGLTSPEFREFLFAYDRDPVSGAVTRERLKRRPDHGVKFTVQVSGALASHGLEMPNTATGAITVLSTVPAATKGHSFLVTAAPAHGTAPTTARVRVHIHGGIRGVWLTPFPLTVRKGARNVRLSLLAEFDDGVIGDITNWSPPPTHPAGDPTFVHVRGSTTPVLAWEASAAGSPAEPSPIEAHKDTGVLTAVRDTGTADIIVKGLGQTGVALAFCAPPWSTPVDVTLLSGPGFDQMHFVPNILFLPDGFLDSERGEFEKQVRRVVLRLSSRNRTRPFGVQGFPINFKMNYFMAWVPSNNAGVSVLNELDRLKQQPDGTETARALELPSPQRPATAATEWSLPQMINEVGLPTALGLFTSRPFDERVQAWRSLYGTQVERSKVVLLDGAWLLRRDRVLVNELDTAFHLAFAERPAVDVDRPQQVLAFNPRRLHPDDFAAFLDALREPPSRNFPRGRDLPDVWSAGKDSRLIVFLARSDYKGGSNALRRDDSDEVVGSMIGVSLGPGRFHRVKRQQNGSGWDVAADPDPFPREPHHQVWMTAAHELGHSCDLGEEYVDTLGPPTQGALDAAAGSPNNQVRDTLLNVAGQLRADNIRWRLWPRIAKAAALFSDPHPLAPGRFRVSVAVKPRPGFAKGDVVRLRTRPLAGSVTSGRFLVDSVTPAGVQLEIVALPGTAAGADLPTRFPAGSIVMRPVRARDPNPQNHQYGDDIGMVTDAVIARIDLTHNPLNAHPLEHEAPFIFHDVENRPCPDVELPVPTPATNFPGGVAGAPKPKPLFSSWVIGLYENAGHHRCGIYRPTGVCIMGTEAQTIGKDNFLYEFCQLCRYAIVDALFPTAHADVEIDYHSRYGL